jgi:myosin heavy subunit
MFTPHDFVNEVNGVDPGECTDLASLDPLTQDSLAEMICARYERAAISKAQHGLIYTRAGPVVVAINPLCAVPDLYTEALRLKYHDIGALTRCTPEVRSARLRADALTVVSR